MEKLKTSLAAKAAAVLLTLIIGAGGFWTTVFTIGQWDTLWLGSSYYDSNDCYDDLMNREVQLHELARLLQAREWEGTLPYLDQRRLENLEEALSAEHTNFRFTIRRNDTGILIYSNLEGSAALEDHVHAVEQTELIVAQNSGVADYDYKIWDSGRGYYLLNVVLPDGTVQLFLPEDVEQAAYYGYTYDGYDDWDYDEARDSRVTQSVLALEYGVADPLIVRDEFWSGQQDFQSYVRYLPLVAVLALVLDACAGVLLVFLFRAAGWQAGRPRPVLNWFDRIPFDALAFCAFWIIAVLINAGDSITYGLNTLELVTELWVGLGFITIGVMGTLLALCLTAAVRIRAGTFWHNNVLRMLGSLIGRGLRALARAWPLTGRTVLLFLLYVVCSVFFLSLPFPVWVALQAVALFALCRWTLQWRRVRDGTERILGGEPEFKIDTSHMYYDLAAHAGQLNDLGEAVGTAVDERLRSERFKAELITNVSHDLKTPLTSIINYVDLLRKQGLDSPHAPEYLEVLERKSHRLKKLTEDLVEASKASTGSLPVHLERLGMVQLLQQALGEWEERFVQSGLTAVPTYPAEEAWIMADGRHLWRVIDNLLSNCNKYALEGTRIYIGVTVWEGQVRLSIKNVSRQALNIPAEQLMERFVRGEESRTTEGSGLGLSIARSLTELQGGQFRLDIDGDLFKAAVAFPEAPAQPESLPPAN